MKTLFVLVDALKSNYVNEDNMPFLYSLLSDNYFVKEIIPCSGFCERSEIFSGKDGYETGNFTAIGYIPEGSPYKNKRCILRLFHYFEKINSNFTRRLFGKWRVLNRVPLKAYRIPFTSLDKFALTEDGTEKIAQYDDIFDLLNKKHLTYCLDAFTSLSDIEPRLKCSLDEYVTTSINKSVDFVPIYIGVIDSVGHTYGSDISKIKPYLRQVDGQLEKYYNVAKSKGYAFSVLGDHGMVPVNKSVDVMRIVNTTGLKLSKDYEVFYDSTIARFWFYNHRSEKQIRCLLEKVLLEDGFIVDTSNSEKYRINLDLKAQDGKPIYGDLLWCAHPGVLISPDYFHSKESKESGMHGYIECVHGDGTGILVSTELGNMTIPQMHSSQVFDKLCELLELK